MTETTLSDAEVVAAFMEPKPLTVPDDAEDMQLCGSAHRTPLGFWICLGGYDNPQQWRIALLTLNECHEVEAKLTDEQWNIYEHELPYQLPHGPCATHELRLTQRGIIHATAEQKIKALAAVLRA